MIVKIINFFKNIFKKKEYEDDLEYIDYCDKYVSELNKCNNIEENRNGNLE
tara:strand:+ start:92 stop:244 length:153 start_codon:yes stop_codon:yes gene_type:complete